MDVNTLSLPSIVATRCQYVSELWREHASCDLVTDVLMEVTGFLDDVSNSLAFCSEEVELARSPWFIFCDRGVLRGVFIEGDDLVLNTLPQLSDSQLIATGSRNLQQIYHDERSQRLIILRGVNQQALEWDCDWDGKILVFDLAGMRLAGEWYTMLGVRPRDLGKDRTVVHNMTVVEDHVFICVAGKDTQVLVAALEQGAAVVYLRSVLLCRHRCDIRGIYPSRYEGGVAVEVACLVEGACTIMRLRKIQDLPSQTTFTKETMRVAEDAERVPWFRFDYEWCPIIGSRLFMVDYFQLVHPQNRSEFFGPPRVLLTDFWGRPKSPVIRCNIKSFDEMTVDNHGTLYVAQCYVGGSARLLQCFMMA
ncbi:hypothetical protein FOZ60_000393 [Perkinsus olseni]|uniref:Uncharacterized protein n=1 Tax=Perkinsus olseni TaxID=32597 RepID=A0A7J6MZG1_PEROL|nr:hypothetical protein FOZ60_000393 [Perkinsus olseni]